MRSKYCSCMIGYIVVCKASTLYAGGIYVYVNTSSDLGYNYNEISQNS